MRTALLLAAVCLSGCASIVEGTGQEIFVDITPAAASCDAFREGQIVGAYSPATHSVMVKKSKEDLVLKCRAPGYKDKEVRLVSTASAWGVVGALTLDFGLIDYATGALNKYDASIQIVMEREEAPDA
jgi:hypothetical protein